MIKLKLITVTRIMSLATVFILKQKLVTISPKYWFDGASGIFVLCNNLTNKKSTSLFSPFQDQRKTVKTVQEPYVLQLNPMSCYNVHQLVLHFRNDCLH